MSMSTSSKDPKLDTVHTTHRTTTTTTPTTMNIYSSDPLVYTVPNLLSDMECQDLCHHVNNLEQKKKNGTQRVMTRSNPPELSLNIAKLWPLPFLSLGAGIPSLYHLFLQDPSSSSSFVDHTLTAITTTTTTTNTDDTVFSPSMEQIWNTVLPPMIMAFLLSIGLAYGIVLPLLRRMSMSSSSSLSFRTSVALALNQEEDFDIIQPLVDRIVEHTNHPWDHWEAPVITRYDPGAIFSCHCDASLYRGKEWMNIGGQRIITCICYLNSLQQQQQEEQGGETYFDKLQFGIVPKQGMTLIFFPANSKTLIADDRTTHESLAPTCEKWIVQMFGRVQRVPPPLGLPDSYGKKMNK